ncbi:hypothetical protein DPMN_060915 [Dreissena polymorpha]|uniref:Uncharacterized protein n=1 Tax=Dreissena polymorpha TaxID=45954 RepID=A0A9D4HIP8_DREPO|nr:hypothetical protein DPMN_060905 [Dreissena polymorpha]KAH3718116.1 hypothetical protein DPMN_060915 [Dreissena polymorpha]
MNLSLNNTDLVFCVYNVSAITENDLGHSVTVCIEPSNSSNKLQTMPLTSVMVQDGKR